MIDELQSVGTEKVFRGWYHIAYGCFLFSGCLAVFPAILDAIPQAQSLVLVWASLILMPFGFLGFLAMIVGTVIALGFWRHAPLPILSGLSLAFVALFLFVDETDPRFKLATWVYGLAAILIPLRWYLRPR